MPARVDIILKTKIQSDDQLDTKAIYALNVKSLRIVNIKEYLTMFVKNVQMRF